MILTLDLGNSTLSAAFFKLDGTGPLYHETFQLAGTVTSALIKGIMKTIRESSPSGKVPTGAILSSVVPGHNDMLEQSVQETFSLPLLQVDHTLKLNLELEYQDPSRLGKDRIANAVAALELHGPDTLVADLGTATTFTLVHQGRLQGGLIAPGIITSLNALSQQAWNLEKVELRPTPGLIANTTDDAIRSGMVNGWTAMIQGIYRQICQHYNRDYHLVLTGGLSGIISPGLEVSHEVDPFLVMKGAAIIYRLNSQV